MKAKYKLHDLKSAFETKKTPLPGDVNEFFLSRIRKWNIPNLIKVFENAQKYGWYGKGWAKQELEMSGFDGHEDSLLGSFNFVCGIAVSATVKKYLKNESGAIDSGFDGTIKNPDIYVGKTKQSVLTQPKEV